MDIKRLVHCQSLRHRLLRMFSWLPDSVMLPIQYYLILHRWPNMKHPNRFTEKIQCYKAYYRNPQMLDCVDKYKVRKYVKDKLGTDVYLNTLYQICDRAEEIDFESLPNQFVIKTTDGGGGDNVYICRDKALIDKKSLCRKINSWRNKNYPVISREWAYRGAKQSRIIVEEFLSSSEYPDRDIFDYKFMCFNGKVKFFWVDIDRFANHKRFFYNENMEAIKDIVWDYPASDGCFVLPKNIQDMILIAEKLSEDFPFARIDLYNISGKIVFGEITFYPASGYTQAIPDSFDYKLGSYFTLERFEEHRMV